MSKRDKAYMELVLAQLESYWKQFPELRLCQLIANATSSRTSDGDIFYVEDKDLVHDLSEFEDKFADSEPATSSVEVVRDVHTEHCCKHCGCKYGNEYSGCSVYSGSLEQSFKCGDNQVCNDNDGWL